MSEEIRNEESKSGKFVRLAESRVNKTLKSISGLENLSNHNTYSYTSEQVNVMFDILEKELARVKESFAPKKTSESASFSFGAIAPAASEDDESDDTEDESAGENGDEE